MVNSAKIMSLGKKFIPLMAGIYQLWFGSPNPGWQTVKSAVESKNYQNATQSLVAALSGVRLQGGGQAETKFDLMGVMNPVDFRNAPVPKVILLSRLAMEGIDQVGTFISGLFKDLLK